MNKYTVVFREIHLAYHTVDADSPEDAMKRVAEGEGDLKDTLYSHTPNDTQVDVYDESDKLVIHDGEKV